MKKYYLFLIILLLPFSCTGTYKVNKLSKNYSINLQEGFNLLDKLLHDDTIEEIKNMKSPNEMIEYHLSIGQHIRNNWFRHDPHNVREQIFSELKLGYFNIPFDGMSNIILELYWYYINNKEYNIEEIYKKEGYSFFSAINPEIKEDRKEQIEEKIFARVYYKHKNILYFIHIYKIKNSSDYYIYDVLRGWKRIKENEYLELYNEWN
jgi:hypothetical protein